MRKNKRLPVIIAAVVIVIGVACAIVIPQVIRSNRYAQAVKFAEHGLYDDAIELFSYINDYQDSEAYLDYSLMRKAVAAGDYTTAGQYADRIPDFRDASAYKTLCESCFQAKAGNPEAAIEGVRGLDISEAKELLKFWQSEYAKEQNALAETAMEQGNPDLALEYAKHALQYCDNPKLAEKRDECIRVIQKRDYSLAVSMIRAKDFDSAQALLETVDGYGDSVQLLAHLSAGEQGRAYVYALLSGETDPHTLARFYADAGEYGDAVELAAKYQDQADEEDYALALAYISASEWRRAKRIFSSLGDYRDSRAYQALCDCCLLAETGELEAAIEGVESIELSEAKELQKTWKSEYASIMNDRVKTAIAQGDPDQAAALAEHALQYCGDPELAELREACLQQIHERDYGRAVAMIRAKDFGSAQELLETVDGYGDSVQLLSHLSAGEQGRAYAYALLSGEADPHMLSSLYTAAGEYADAAELAAKYQEQADEQDYALAKEYMKAPSGWQEAKRIFFSLGDYRDSRAYQVLCDCLMQAAVGDLEAAIRGAESIELSEAKEILKTWKSGYATIMNDRVTTAMAQEDPDQALALAEHALQYCDDPELAELREACLQQIHERDYGRAVVLIRAKDFGSAQELLETVDGYGDSVQLLLHLSAGEQGRAYAYALLSGETDPHMLSSLYTAAGEYADAEELAAKYQEQADGQDYALAKKYMESSGWQEAKRIFSSLGDYRDSRTYEKMCDDGIRQDEYAEAARLMEKGDYEAAEQAFAALGTYSDSRIRAISCREAIKAKQYERAVRLYEEKSYDEAYAIFTELGDYRDSGLYCRWLEMEGDS